MSVSTEENKQMLIELMKNIMQDNDFTLESDNELRNFIIEKCNYYHTQRFEFGGLSEINKKIVEMSYNFLLMKNKNKNKVPMRQKTIQEENMSRRAMFNKGLEIQQKNFEKMIQPKKPKEIDFSDANKDKPISNLSVIMNQTLADRQKELQTITQQYSITDQREAKKWLNNDKTMDIESQTPKIQIEHNTSVPLKNTIDVSKEKKRVHFEVQDKNPKTKINELFAKLKMKSTNNPVTQNKTETDKEQEIMKKLNTIISNQEKILDLLQIKSKESNNDELESFGMFEMG
ncbi:MAG: hypothetical protein CL678_02045 [Bdellovibrionaceae bacterium]|nr:hypothetical protein [Pseudobdellovibrionaceae bacterium]|tara:strand:+ start:384 stop:1247 length:864 start_codon:yes stop_codon:yes gene_type:complete